MNEIKNFLEQSERSNISHPSYFMVYISKPQVSERLLLGIMSRDLYILYIYIYHIYMFI